MSDKDVLLAWRDLTVAVPGAKTCIFKNANGYVPRGGMVATVGVSSAGKTTLLKTLSGRSKELLVDGTIMMDGHRMAAADARGDVTMEEDMLIGELTVREALRTAVALKSYDSKEKVDEHLDHVLDQIGLGHVADSVIGTVLKRGLSGGQKRRCSVAMELVACPTVMMIDELTSGLDSNTAFALINYLETLVRGSDKLGILVSLQQPNKLMLSVFDLVLVVGLGGPIFFGTCSEAFEHFETIGFACPEDETPTDFYLQVTDVPPTGPGGYDFVEAYTTSKYAAATISKIDACIASASEERQDLAFKTSSWRQMSILLARNLRVARRDVTLYWLQLVLHSGYGFLVGAVFFSLDPFVIGSRLNDAFNGVTWLAFISTYIHIFKTNYLVVNNARFYHEYQNRAYGAVPYWVAEMISTAIGTCAFLPGITISYFMIGLPSAAFGFNLLNFYILCLTAEASIHFVSLFFKSAAYATVVAQSFLVLLSIFSTGSLIRPDKVPEGWKWLQEVSYYYWGTRGSAVSVFKEITYTCAGDSFAFEMNNQCQMPLLGVSFNCDVSTSPCKVSGTHVLDEYKSIDGPNEWSSLGRLIALMMGFRLLVLVLYMFPVTEIYSKLVELFLPETDIKQLPCRVRTEVPPAAADVSEQANVSFEAAAAGKPQLVWDHLTLSLGNGKVLIDDVSGVAVGGRCQALMGPSGAGKTTLLNALCGRATYAKVKGNVTFCGRQLGRDDLDFVPQFDELSDFFSVRESIMYIGRMKKKQTESTEALAKRVDHLLNILNLKTMANERPSGLTGGQRKRASIALGLIAQAPLIFMDEPTTGLDSAAAYSIVKYIVKIARETGVVCIMTIHQPSAAVFASLDDVYLLEMGRLCFSGTQRGALSFFKDVGFQKEQGLNPADFFLDLISYSPAEAAQLREISHLPFDEKTTWSSLFANSSSTQNVRAIAATGGMENASSAADRTPELARASLLLYKSLINHYRFPVYRLRAIQLFFQGVIIGTLFWRTDHTVANLTEISGANFINIWVVLFAVVAGAPVFCVERRLVQSDFVNGAYTLATSAVTQFVASLPMTLVCAVVYQVPLHYMAGFNDHFPAFVYAVLMSFALMLVMEAIVLSIVEGLKNPMLSTTFSMIVLGLLFLFPGFFLPVGDMPPSVSWVPYIIPSTWGTQGSLNNALVGQDFELPSGGRIDGSVIFTSVYKYSSNVEKWEDWLVVVAWALFWRFVHYGMTWYTNRNFGKSQQSEDAQSSAAPAYAAESVPETKQCISPSQGLHTDKIVSQSSTRSMNGVIVTEL